MDEDLRGKLDSLKTKRDRLVSWMDGRRDILRRHPQIAKEMLNTMEEIDDIIDDLERTYKASSTADDALGLLTHPLGNDRYQAVRFDPSNALALQEWCGGFLEQHPENNKESVLYITRKTSALDHRLNVENDYYDIAYWGDYVFRLEDESFVVIPSALYDVLYDRDTSIIRRER